MPSFNQRLKELRLKAELSQQSLADGIGISKSSINMYERGEREPGSETLEAFADFFNVDMNYLLGATDTIRTPIFVTNRMRVPVLGYVAAGIPIDAITDVLDYEELSPEMVKDGSEYFALQIKGASMEPKISEGDVVIVRKQADCENGQIAIVCVNGDQATCKRVMKQASGILLQPLNPAYEPIFYTAEQIQNLPITILGRVVELRAKF